MSKQNTGYSVQYIDISPIGDKIFTGKTKKNMRMVIRSGKNGTIYYGLFPSTNRPVLREDATRKPSNAIEKLDAFDKAVYDAVVTIYANKRRSHFVVPEFSISLIGIAMYGNPKKKIKKDSEEYYRIIDSLNVMSQLKLKMHAPLTESDDRRLPENYDPYSEGVLLPIKPCKDDFSKYEFIKTDNMKSANKYDQPPLFTYDELSGRLISINNRIFGTNDDFKIKRKTKSEEKSGEINLRNNETTLLVKRYLIYRLERLRNAEKRGLTNLQNHIRFKYSKGGQDEGMIYRIGKKCKNLTEYKAYVDTAKSILNFFKEISYIDGFEIKGESDNRYIVITKLDDGAGYVRDPVEIL